MINPSTLLTDMIQAFRDENGQGPNVLYIGGYQLQRLKAVEGVPDGNSKIRGLRIILNKKHPDGMEVWRTDTEDE